MAPRKKKQAAEAARVSAADLHVKGLKSEVQDEVLPKSWTKVMRQSHFEFCIGQDLTHSIFL